jgi:two-component system cell cycle response regulator
MARCRVLCVDDDPLFLNSIVRLLEVRLGETIASAHSVQRAREILAAEGNEIAVVLTDYKMPGETGLDLLAHLAAEHPDVVGVLTTAYAELEVAIEAINQGHVYALLRKPAGSEEILITLQQALERHELVHTLREQVGALERANADLQQAYEELAHSKEEVERLNEMAYYDAKTGVRSYRFLAERLDEEVARAQRYSHPFTLILIDLDGFKPVNDRLGHTAGDVVLKAFADLMQSKIRGVDVLARFGGDEFAVLLPSTDAAGASTVSQRLGQEVRETALGPLEPGEITISMGVASVPEHPVRNGKQLVDLADTALYKAKQAGGDCTRLA